MNNTVPDAPPPERTIADRMMAEFQAYWDRHGEFKARASGHPVTEIERRLAAIYNERFRADIAARSEAETPLCPVHRSLDRQGTLELSVGNGCVACALNERKELLEALATALPPEGADSVSFMRELVLSAIHIKESAARSEGEAARLFHRGVDAAKEAIRSEVDAGTEARLSAAWDKSDAEFDAAVSLNQQSNTDESHYYAALFINAIARKCGTPSDLSASTPATEVERALVELSAAVPDRKPEITFRTEPCKVEIGLYTPAVIPNDAISFTGANLAEAMQSVREWQAKEKE